jgi:hypothetical protein
VPINFNPLSLQSALNQQSELIIVDGINDLEEKPFTIDKTRYILFKKATNLLILFCYFSDQTLEKLIGLESYNQPLSIAGLVYTEIGHTIIMQKFPERYDLLINSQHIVQRNLNRDFRKIYEFFIEVVDSFHFGKELVYSTPEKKELYAYLQNLKNRMKNANYEGGESFVAFAEEFSNEIGGIRLLYYTLKCDVISSVLLQNVLKIHLTGIWIVICQHLMHSFGRLRRSNFLIIYRIIFLNLYI